MVQSFHAAVFVFTFRALEKLLLSRLLVRQVGVGVEVELVEILEEFGADVTPILLVAMETGVLQEQIQVSEEFTAGPDRAFVILL